MQTQWSSLAILRHHSAPRPLQNHLIESLSCPDRAQLLSICSPHPLVRGEIVAEAGEPTRHVHFPTSGFVSVVADREGTSRLEVGMVGCEGMLGGHLALGATATPLRAIVQGAGSALRAGTADFLHLLDHAPGLRRVMGRYLDVRAAQLADLAICLRFHGLDARLARWMLMSQDRVSAPSFLVTHEVLAQMLGVRRAGVTRAAIALQEQGLIRYARGTVTVLDRAGMQAAACSCYELDRALYNRSLGPRPRREAGAQA